MRIAILAILLFSQSALAKDFIVRFKNQHMLQQESLEAQAFHQMFQVEETLVKDMQIVTVKNLQESTNALQALRTFSFIKWAQEDHPVKLRERNPNDSEFEDQWAHQIMESPKAWEQSIGGKTKNGHEIVIAIVDGGVDVNHPDLKDNIWVNHNEIPNNNIDDDNNGYIDDVNGWNAHTNSGDQPANNHGTHVAGIVGARGNNSQQVAGINWNIKIMGIAGSSNKTSKVLKAYSYALKQKQIWLETGGQKGANVVVTNSSFGIDGADCTSKDYPAWDDIYEEMGKHGILSAAATANRNWNIDEVGDVPTGCSSDYIIAVTNTDFTDKKYNNAGYGLNTIDLGAPGTKVLSTVPPAKTAEYTGTSMATPQVAGTVGFIHSVASPELTQLALDKPAKAALIIKDIILSTTTPNSSLKEKTVTGGRLNLNNATISARRFPQK